MYQIEDTICNLAKKLEKNLKNKDIKITRMKCIDLVSNYCGFSNYFKLQKYLKNECASDWKFKISSKLLNQLHGNNNITNYVIDFIDDELYQNNYLVEKLILRGKNTIEFIILKTDNEIHESSKRLSNGFAFKGFDNLHLRKNYGLLHDMITGEVYKHDEGIYTTNFSLNYDLLKNDSKINEFEIDILENLLQYVNKLNPTMTILFRSLDLTENLLNYMKLNSNRFKYLVNQNLYSYGCVLWNYKNALLVPLKDYANIQSEV